MQINQETIEYLQQLSKLKLSPQEIEKAKTDLQGILEQMEHLNDLDTGSIQGLCNPNPGNNVFREDEVAASFSREAILRNAPDQQDGYYKVPKTVE